MGKLLPGYSGGLFGGVLIALLTVGCSGEDTRGDEGVGSTTLEARVAEILLEGGVEFQSLVVDREAWLVTVDEDIIMDLNDLVGPPVDEMGHRFGTQGYYYSAGNSHGVPIFSPPRANSIKLAFSPSISQAWRTAFTQAAAEWNPNPCIEIGTGSPGSLSIQSSAFGAATTYADALFPTKTSGTVQPGSRIRLNLNYSCGVGCNIESLSPQLKKHVATHEIGHALGFAHTGTSVHVPTTASGSYSSIMNDTAGESTALAGLTGDDKKTRDTVFKKIQIRGAQVCP